MGCFSGIVTLKGCSADAGGVFTLNALPGISLRDFNDVANVEQVNYIGVWENINIRAEARMLMEITNRMSKRYDIRRVRKTVDTAGSLPLANTTPDGVFRGIVINNGWTYTENWVSSPFQLFSIDKIRFYKRAGTTATSVDIQFFNFLTKDLLLTKTVDLTGVPNDTWVSVDILERFSCAALGIGFDDTDINSVSYSDNDANEGWGGCMDYCFDINCGYLRAFTSDTATRGGNLAVGDTIVGLTAVVTMGCEYEAAICNNKRLFAEAYWYLLGIEFLTEKMYSERINFATSVRREDAEALLALYQVRYEQALDNAIAGLRFGCDACVECDSIVAVTSRIP
jgi:hypothetical protein